MQKFKTDPKKFEHLCKWVARENYGPNVFLYKRHRQEGIDIIWTDKGKQHVIQCKLREKPLASELISSLENDFMKALQYFSNGLEQFIFATTANLKIVERKVKRHNGVTESVSDVCNRLAFENGIRITCWHWEYLEERVEESPFLMKHLSNRVQGADMIEDDFIETELAKY